MKSTDLIQPTAIQTPIAVTGDKVIPNQTATSIDTSSIEAGFLPITSQPLESGGEAPERTDFNGMFYLATDQRVFLQNGGFITYDADVVSAIGGYPQNAVLGYLTSNGFGFVRSLIDDNAYNFVETPSYINGEYWEYVPITNFVEPLDTKVSKSGDTMSGDLIINKNHPSITLHSTNADISNSDPTIQASCSLAILDKKNNLVGAINYYENASNNHGMAHTVTREVNGTNVQAGIMVGVDSSGVPYYAISNPAIARGAANDLLFTRAISKAANGYCVLGNGIIMQWGKTSSAKTGTTTFPKAFTSAESYSLATTPSSGLSEPRQLGMTGHTATSFSWASYQQNAQWGAEVAMSYNWIAIGY